MTELAPGDRLRSHPRSHLRPHLWTVAPRLAHAVRPRQAPPAAEWSTVVLDPTLGPVRLSGRLRLEAAGGHAGGAGEGGESGEGGELVVLVHGLGGTCDSHYMVGGAIAAAAAGVSCLRLNLRGADCSGEDFYHAGLTADLHAALASAELRPFRRISILGYSLGGHLVLRWAAEPGDPRVGRVAAVCSPLDLSLSQGAIDSPEGWLYRRYLIGNLSRIYAAVAARRPMPRPVREIARLRKIRDFDELVVAPRHGFRDADDYYARASAGPTLGDLRVPSLLVNSERDPMIWASAVRPALRRPAPRLLVRWLERGGHVGFPPGIDLGLPGAPTAPSTAMMAAPPATPAAPAIPPSVDAQIIAWLRAAGG